MDYISEASKFMYDDDYIVEGFTTVKSVTDKLGPRGKAKEKDIIAFLKKNKIEDELAASVIGFYGIDGEEYLDKDGNWLDEGFGPPKDSKRDAASIARVSAKMQEIEKEISDLDPKNTDKKKELEASLKKWKSTLLTLKGRKYGMR